MKKLGNKIVYELYPTSFYDSNNDGVGDIKGIIEKLDYLQLLGIDLIWINPIFKSPKNDNGYDIENYLEIDPSFGTMDDVDNLIAEAKKRNIGIMFDMVFNHVSTHSLWFKNAVAGNKKYQDYFYIVKSDDKNKKPSNWVSKFGGSAWEYQEEFNGYYLHLFDKTQIDLNWNNSDVRKEVVDVLNFWIKKGVKGFRFDVINLIGKPEQFIDTNDFGKSLYTDNAKVHSYLKEINEKSFGNYEDIITVGEMSSTTIENCIKYTNPKEKELDMVFSFHHLKVDYLNGEKWKNKPWDKKEFKKIIKDWQLGLQDSGWNAIFLNNHDQPRVNSRYGNTKKYWFESSSLFAILMFSLKGTVFLYQGEEIGMTNPEFNSIDEYRDVESLNAFKILKEQNIDEKEIIKILKVKSRDNSRTPMQWDDSQYAGFSKYKPWIDVAYNFKEINVQKQIQDKNSLFNFYKKLIEVRKANDILCEGSVDILDSQDEIMIIKRTLDNKNVIAILNLSEQEIQYDWKKYSKANILINNYHSVDYEKLSPFQGLILELKYE